MRVLLTGATGIVGGFVVPALAAAGHEVLPLARRGAGLRWSLDAAPPPLPPAEALVHLAFAHKPGAYRGGEGDDPAGFLARNRDGSLALFDAARGAGVGRIVFLSAGRSMAIRAGARPCARPTPPGPIRSTAR